MFNAVCNDTCCFDTASDRKLRIAVHIQATHIARYAGIEESRERAIIQVDTIPAIAGDGRKQKHSIHAGEEFHTITAVPTNSGAS